MHKKTAWITGCPLQIYNIISIKATRPGCCSGARRFLFRSCRSCVPVLDGSRLPSGYGVEDVLYLVFAEKVDHFLKAFGNLGDTVPAAAEMLTVRFPLRPRHGKRHKYREIRQVVPCEQKSYGSHKRCSDLRPPVEGQASRYPCGVCGNVSSRRASGRCLWRNMCREPQVPEESE